MARFLTLALLALPLACAAQSSNVLLTRDVNGNFAIGYSLVPPNDRAVQGNINLLAGWVPASLLLTGNKLPTVEPTKYDLLRQELRVRRPKGDSIIVPLSRLQEFTFQTSGGAGRRFVCYPAATLPADAGGGCGEVLANGANLQLLKFWRKVVVQRPSSDNSYASNTNVSQLEQQTRYYLLWPADNHWAIVRLKRASLEQALAGQPAALAALKARKGGLGSETDLAAAVLALDPLLTTPAR
jgi:hypothetical protein